MASPVTSKASTETASKPNDGQWWRSYRVAEIFLLAALRLLVAALFSEEKVHWQIHRFRFYIAFEKFCETVLYTLNRRYAWVRVSVYRLERSYFTDFHPLVLQPYAFDTKADYHTLRTFERRGPYHQMLKDPPDEVRAYPEATVDELVRDLFRRSSGMIESRNSLWYPCLATFHHYSVFSAEDEQFDHTKNITHHAHLQSVYGITEEVTTALRSMKGGKLKTSTINGEAFLPLLSGCPGAPQKGRKGWKLDERERAEFFTCGNDRVNSSPMFLYPAVLYLRMHNQLAEQLGAVYPAWDDERIFQEARNLLIACHFKHLIHEIRFNFGDAFSFVGMSEMKRMPAVNGVGLYGGVTYESKLAYIFHEAIPDAFEVNEQRVAWERLYWRPQETAKLGTVSQWLDCLTRQRCGRLCLQNTPTSLLSVHARHLELARELRMPRFNDYRRRLGLEPYRTFDELTASPGVAAKLEKHYGHVDEVEFYVGIYAEDPWPLSHGLPDYVGPIYSIILKSTLSQLAFNSPFISPNILGIMHEESAKVLNEYDNNYWFERAGVPMDGRNAFFSDWYREKYLEKSLLKEAPHRKDAAQARQGCHSDQGRHLQC